MKNIVIVLVFLLPSCIARILLNLCGNDISRGARIGFSILKCDYIKIANNVAIGNFNFIKVEYLDMKEFSSIGMLNVIRGPFKLSLEERSMIGRSNWFSRAAKGITVGDSEFKLGIYSKITVGHRIDLTKSVVVGDYSILAGYGSQLWTHGYIHAEAGLDRYRIDGAINIGSNVYIGSASFVSLGVTIANGAIVGGGTSVAKDLLDPGLYVSSALRKLPRPVDPNRRSDLVLIDRSLSEDIVFLKRGT